MTSPARTPWAVHCPMHGKVYLTNETYMAQLARVNSLWECPICRQPAWWDDENYEDFQEPAEL